MKTKATISENEIVIDHKSTPIIIQITLSLILLICLIIPLLVTFLVLSNGDGFHFGILISFMLFWGAGIYLLRVVLWNNYGKEIISLNNSGLTYIADYRFFKDGQKTVDSQNLQIEIIYEDTMDNYVGRLKIFNETKEIETVLQSNLTDLEEMMGKIKTRYNKSNRCVTP